MSTSAIRAPPASIWPARSSGRTTRIDYAPVHGNGGSPVLVDGLLIFSCDGADEPFVVALDANTGKESWRFSRASDSPKQVLVQHAAVIDGRRPEAAHHARLRRRQRPRPGHRPRNLARHATATATR